MAEQLKLPEVARRLGVSEKTARRYIKSGKLPSVFIGGTYRVEEEDLEVFLQGARVSPPGKAPSRSSLEPSLFNGIEGERHDSVYSPWLEFVNGFADRWEQRIAGGTIDQGALDEFVGTIEGLFPILGRLGLQEKQEKPEESEDYSFGPIMSEAFGRLSALFDPLFEAGVKQDEGSDLARLRRRREEMVNEQTRAASG